MDMKKYIAVCTTKINDEFSRNFISMFHKAACSEGYNVTVFQSVFDFYNSTTEAGARTIFGMLPYSELCAVVILRDAIFDRQILDTIINGALENNVPVIMARGTDERCYSITASFEEAYMSLIGSVIKDQGIKDTFYIAGRRQDDPDSAKRLSIYKKVLEANGCEYDPDRVEYGEYWETPTLRAIDRMIEKNGKVPEAILCANDIMAFTVMEKLRDMGVRIPEDTVVTGFDGLETAKYCTPTLSTCCEDTYWLAETALATVKTLSDGKKVNKVQYYPYKAAIRQSSARNCKVPPEDFDTKLFFRMRDDEINERRYNDWLDKVIAVPNIENLRRNMPDMAEENYSVAIRADAFLDADSGAEADRPSEYLMMLRDKKGGITETFVPSASLIRKYFELIPEGQVGIFSMISNSDFVYGAVFTPTADIKTDAQRINRYIMTLNRALYIALCGEKLRRNTNGQQTEKYIDALTGMLNIDGANKWFADTVINDFSRNIQLTAGVYTFINYQKVLEKYGTHILEENMQYIAKSLKLANPDDAVIARISVDSFGVFILHDPNENISAIVDGAITLFYGSLDVKSRSKNKNSDIEVSCGYHETETPWCGKLSDYLNAATSNLYKNRVSFDKNLPKSVDLNDGTQVLEFRAAFMALINEDLFTYHFQPIVDAKTGEIVAYEALMRTNGGIIMSPIEVLAAATMFSKLDQVEFMSFMNIFKRMTEEKEKFGERSVFINTIPGHFLSRELCGVVCEQYGDLLPRAVIEITESETITVDELETIRTFGGRSNIRIAVDDYGTGHSNIVNLMEYKPHIVKIDRYLISNIQNDKNKQMFVKNLIEFSQENNIKVLAEGVETSDELDTVIDFGVDYIQGYYTARPGEEVIQQIPDDIKAQIAGRAAMRKEN